MRVLDPGHDYEMDALDGGAPARLTFVKRVGEKYPGNVDAHGGVIVQEVLRVLIDRLLFVNRQEPDHDTASAIHHLRYAFYVLEARAAMKHKRSIPSATLIECANHCPACGHVECAGECGRTG